MDEYNHGKAEDFEDAVPDEHLVHPVLLLPHDDSHGPGVEDEGQEEKGDR